MVVKQGVKKGTGAAPVKNADVWVVIPLYNEESVIGGVVSDLLEHWSNVVCIDDGSTDNSAAVAQEHGARVLRHPINLGQGAALQTGIEFARERPGTQFLITFDADGQHRIQDALEMLERARAEDLAIVFGSRFLDSRTKLGWAKRIVLRTAAWVTNRTTHLRLTDAHNGLRVLRTDAARGVNMQQDRMAHATEIVQQLGKTNLPWREHPVEVIYTDYSRAKGQSLLNSINILVDLIVH